MAGFLIPLVIFAFVGIVALWPGDFQKTPFDAGGKTKGKVESVVRGSCDKVDDSQNADTSDMNAGNQCVIAVIGFEVLNGPEAGSSLQTNVTASNSGTPIPRVGTTIYLERVVDQETQVASYYLTEVDRRPALGLFALLTAVLVMFIGRWRGFGALIGVAITWLVLVYFMLPSMLSGHSPTMVAIVGSTAIILVVLYVAHGLNARTTTAVIGTLLTLFITAFLAILGAKLAYLTGFSSEEVSYVKFAVQDLDLKGLLLAGIVIGALGVLNDMTVTQASAVWELHAVKPAQHWYQLYKAGMRVGRDHIASSIYTLVLAYTGASLPLLLLFVLSGQSVGTIINSQFVGEEIIRTLIGSVGLILSAPITTALAAIVVSSSRVENEPEQETEPVATPATATAVTEE